MPVLEQIETDYFEIKHQRWLYDKGRRGEKGGDQEPDLNIVKSLDSKEGKS
jgi:hypothetical protein